MIELDRVVLQSKTFSLEVPSLRLKPGQPTVLVGRNGGGKSTLMEAILGLRPLAQGEIRIEDQPAPSWLKRAENKRRLGVQLQAMSYPAKTRVAEVVGLHHVLYRGRHSTQIAQELAIPAIADRYYERLSRGEKQRVDLYIALSHDPELVLLDEPTTGLDASFVERALALIASFTGRADKTVLYASHIAREVQLARELAWIENGRLGQEPLANYMASRFGTYCGELAVGPAQAEPLLAAASQLPAVRTTRISSHDRLLAFGEGELFKTAFLNLAEHWAAGHTLRLVDYDDLLKNVSCREGGL
ncbi:ATP-binding cassette domain-containing protein [Chitinimonas lacunae]|uniref:ATP-binding cassette domain-containing protein n=1 Tax=Chitinimonas lacunae TaxID=1963018 RepID=A0ABV8MP66_9NEIS